MGYVNTLSHAQKSEIQKQDFRNAEESDIWLKTRAPRLLKIDCELLNAYRLGRGLHGCFMELSIYFAFG